MEKTVDTLIGRTEEATTARKNGEKTNAKKHLAEVSTLRLYLLRAMYLFIAIGLALTKWPGILNPPANATHMGNVVGSMLGALSLLVLLGTRYPLKMLPLLFFEFLWKAIWVLAFALPLWSGGQLDPATRETLIACLIGLVLVPLVMPWGYVLKQYLQVLGDRWGRQVTASTPK
jgi:hypothetical protein